MESLSGLIITHLNVASLIHNRFFGERRNGPPTNLFVLSYEFKLNIPIDDQ